MGQTKQGQLGFAATWALAAGGMVGGGIYTALGVVVAVAVQWSWLSFIIAGIVALTSAYSYAFLANRFEQGGGAFEFLREIHRKGVAGSLSWMLIVGYVLTMSVYAYAFGHYVAFALGAGPWVTRGLAIAIMALLIGLNLMGTGKTSSVEIVIVAGNLIILIGLGVLGLLRWDPVQLVAGVEPRPIWGAGIGAASIFMSYEGFQLLAYEYDEIKRPKQILKPALLSAVLFVILVYAAVSVGATMLAGALTVVDQKQVALSVAAEVVAGRLGVLVMTVAAGFATAAAINSTLFSTAKLSRRVADDGELPRWFKHRNSQDVPDRAVIFLGALAALLAVIGSLSTLVEAASLVFLFTFGTVNWIATQYLPRHRWIPWTGVAIAAAIALVLMLRLAILAPLTLALLAGFAALAMVGRPMILKRLKAND
ncbi:APC family permease [Nodosilinea nodulosa]|uniref:APC family permease n=1 Tax=Nodosilinea nodulosa TaxID=416001 RepID=UPI00031E4E25|nr:APC family permease [Nodosilinea nodulosa]